MRRKQFLDARCPILRSVTKIGEWWSILILRDAALGLTRFDQFSKSLQIAPNILTRRLRDLVDAGMLERRRYSEKPPRAESVLPARGRAFRPVLVDSETGEVADPVLVDRPSGRLLERPAFRSAPGPAANGEILERYRKARAAPGMAA